MEQWEHAWISGDLVSDGAGAVLGRLNELGQEGWHLVQAVTPYGGSYAQALYLLR